LSARGTSTLLNNALLSAHFLFADHTGGIAHIRFQENHVPFVGDFNYA